MVRFRSQAGRKPEQAPSDKARNGIGPMAKRWPHERPVELARSRWQKHRFVARRTSSNFGQARRNTPNPHSPTGLTVTPSTTTAGTQTERKSDMLLPLNPRKASTPAWQRGIAERKMSRKSIHLIFCPMFLANFWEQSNKLNTSGIQRGMETVLRPSRTGRACFGGLSHEKAK